MAVPDSASKPAPAASSDLGAPMTGSQGPGSSSTVTVASCLEALGGSGSGAGSSRPVVRYRPSGSQVVPVKSARATHRNWFARLLRTVMSTVSGSAAHADR